MHSHRSRLKCECNHTQPCTRPQNERAARASEASGDASATRAVEQQHAQQQRQRHQEGQPQVHHTSARRASTAGAMVMAAPDPSTPREAPSSGRSPGVAISRATVIGYRVAIPKPATSWPAPTTGHEDASTTINVPTAARAVPTATIGNLAIRGGPTTRPSAMPIGNAAPTTAAAAGVQPGAGQPHHAPDHEAELRGDRAHQGQPASNMPCRGRRRVGVSTPATTSGSGSRPERIVATTSTAMARSHQQQWKPTTQAGHRSDPEQQRGCHTGDAGRSVGPGELRLRIDAMEELRSNQGDAGGAKPLQQGAAIDGQRTQRKPEQETAETEARGGEAEDAVRTQSQECGTGERHDQQAVAEDGAHPRHLADLAAPDPGRATRRPRRCWQRRTRDWPSRDPP